jgi:hypothetical protein
MFTSDDELLARLGRGDVEAALEFEARFAPPLLAFFGCVVGRDPVVVADLCLETLATARLRARWFDRGPGEVGAWLVELAAGGLRASARAGTVVSDARRRGAVPQPADLAPDDIEAIGRHAGDRRGMRALGDAAAPVVERELARAPAPEALERLRPSVLVRQVGAETATPDPDQWDDAA